MFTKRHLHQLFDIYFLDFFGMQDLEEHRHPLPTAHSQREVTRPQSGPSDHRRRSFRDIMAGRVVWQPRTQIIHHIQDGSQTRVISCNCHLQVHISDPFVDIHVRFQSSNIWWLVWYLLPFSNLHRNRSE